MNEGKEEVFHQEISVVFPNPMQLAYSREHQSLYPKLWPLSIYTHCITQGQKCETNVASPGDNDRVIGCSEQTDSMRARGAPVASIQVDLWGTVDYRSSSSVDATLYILWSWKDSYLRMSGYTLQVKYIGSHLYFTITEKGHMGQYPQDGNWPWIPVLRKLTHMIIDT